MTTAIVVPCYNEERRLEPEAMRRLAALPGIRDILVDDGSTDGTRAMLERIAADAGEAVTVLGLGVNRGKAEAVRAGLLFALEGGADVVGYLDADFSTPVEELPRLLAELDRPGVHVVTGARLARAGARIRRRLIRHLTGRVFATGASMVLGLPFYDTQCGAKLFRDTSALREALARPFLSRWAFDVELLGRLLVAKEPLPFEAFVEVPLVTWTHVSGSKLGPLAMARAGLDLVRIQRDLVARREANART